MVTFAVTFGGKIWHLRRPLRDDAQNINTKLLFSGASGSKVPPFPTAHVYRATALLGGVRT
eukprot:1071000-Rhodomonas_salina.1